MDLNIVARSPQHKNESYKDLATKILTSFKLGYEVVALNTIIDGNDLLGKEVKIPEPLAVNLGNAKLAEALVGQKKYKVLSRLTVIVSDNYQCHRLMQSPIMKKYDILAFQPTDVKVFQHLCGSVEFEIVSFDFTKRLPFTLKTNNIKQATQRGIAFEINYSPCIGESLPRRFTISGANTLVEVMKGKDIIISSGAQRVMQLRGTHDAANLANLFGFSQNQGKAAVFTNAQKVLIHSDIRRKTGFGVVSVQDLDNISSSEQWLKDACTYLTKLDKGTTEETIGTTNTLIEDVESNTITEPLVKKPKIV